MKFRMKKYGEIVTVLVGISLILGGNSIWVNGRFNSIDRQLNGIGSRLETLENRLNSVDKRLVFVESAFGIRSTSGDPLQDPDRRIIVRLDSIRQFWPEHFKKLVAKLDLDDSKVGQ